MCDSKYSNVQVQCLSRHINTCYLCAQCFQNIYTGILLDCLPLMSREPPIDVPLPVHLRADVSECHKRQ